MQTIETVLELTVKASDWQAYHKAKEIALAAEKAAEAQWQLAGLPAKGEQWAILAKLKDGETCKVIVRDGNGNILSSGTISQRTNPPRKASTFWVSPRL